MTNDLHYTKTYPVRVYETGSNGLLAIHYLFNYLQDIASEHASRLRFGRDDLLKANKFWVLSRIYVNVNYWPEWEEEINITTWPRGTDKLFAIRDYKIVSAKERNVAEASSSWLVLDMATRRIQKPDSLLTNFKSDLNVESATGRNAAKIELPGTMYSESKPIHVLQSNLDVNMHVNNTNYIKWISDTFQPEFMQKSMPYSIEINFIAESKFGDELFVRSWSLNNEMVSFHSIVRISDGSLICNASVKWKEPVN